MRRMAGSWFDDFTITKEDIEEWHALEGKFCVGFLEGKLKEHARREPLQNFSRLRDLERMESVTSCS